MPVDHTCIHCLQQYDTKYHTYDNYENVRSSKWEVHTAYHALDMTLLCRKRSYHSSVVHDAMKRSQVRECMLCCQSSCYLLSTGTYSRIITVSATLYVVWTKYFFFFPHIVSCCVLVTSVRDSVPACLPDFPPASACGQATCCM